MLEVFYNAPMVKQHIHSLDAQAWTEWLDQEQFSPKVLNFVLDFVYQKKLTANLPSDFPQHLKDFFSDITPVISEVHVSEDSTAKFLIQFSDGVQVESVLIPFNKKPTICLSSQAGCAMNCSFCYTGTQGLKRNLKAEEIIGQYLVVRDWMKENQKIEINPNIVFMGQGEPFHNWQEVSRALSIFLNKKMVGLGHRQITLSTSGFMEGFNAESLPPINYALSLHSPFESQREELIPINKKYPLKSVIDKLQQIELLPRQFITYEYLLIRDFNMSDEHALALGKLLSGTKSIINLIPFNPFPGSRWERPSKEEIDLFKEKLVEQKLRVMIRTTKGDDILAACGQLKVNKFSRKKNV